MAFAGTEAWPPGCSLRFCGGDNMGVTDWCIVDALAPGEIYDLSIEMTSPMCTGVYQGQWRMSTPTGHYFGGEFHFSLFCSFFFFKSSYFLMIRI